MPINKETGPEEKMPEEKAEEIEEAASERESGEDILKGALEEVESEEEIKKAEDEAYREKEERERYEKMKQEEEEYYEQTLERSEKEGMATFVAMDTAEKMRQLYEEMPLDREEKAEQLIEEAQKYAKEHGYEREHDFKDYLDAAYWARSGTYLEFGPFTLQVEGPFTKKEYLKTMEEAFPLHEEIWEKRKKELGENEILALREKRDREALIKHLEGFGTTALEYGDIETAVNAFIIGGLVENPEIAKKVAEKMKEMINSEKPEVRAKALKAKESLEKYFEEKEKE